MQSKAYFTFLFIIFSAVLASNSLNDKDYQSNYKSNTLEEKIEQMELLELNSSAPVRMPNVKALKKGLMIRSQIDVVGKAASIGKERMIPSSGSRDCEGLSEEDCEWLDFCVWSVSGCVELDNEYEDECVYFEYQDECLASGCSWDEEEGCYESNDEWEDECQGLAQDECVMFDWCMWSYDEDVADYEGFCHQIDEDEHAGCDDGYLQDCSGDGDCCPESWIGDGFADCEDQSWGCDLSCYENDGGDCAGEGDGGGDDGNADDGGTGGDDGGSECVDCVGNDCTGYEQWIGDGICDEGEYGIFYNCIEFECDGGDCGFDSNGECESNWEDDGGNEGCEDGYIEDCADDDCCPESWIGDGLADCEDQSWGCDLSCYENDGGDCEESGDGGDDGGNELGCSDISSDDCQYIDLDGDGVLDCMLDEAGNCVDNDADQECQNYDCMDQCYDGYEGWIGDGYCDDGSWGLYFNCEEFDCDYGDCFDPTTGECAENTDDGGGDDGGGEGCADDEFTCNDGSCIPASWECDVYWCDCSDCEDELDCEESDGGDDGGSEGCDDSQVEDCSDDDCCPASWIGDGLCDGIDQEWGCDLTCYDNDGGDCADSGDDGGDFECSDLGYEDCLYYDFCIWISDSDIDPGFGGQCVDSDWEDDGGNEGCDDGYIEDCADDDCCPESWIGDGFADCEDQAYGCDLSCYDNDSGDCEDSGDDGGNDEVNVALILGDASGIPGGDVEVALSMESSEVVAGIQFTIQSSPADWASAYDFNMNLSTDDCFQADFNSVGDGVVIGLIYSLSGCELEPSNESYQIATLSYEISPNAEFGSGVELYFEEVIVAGAGGEQLDAIGYGGVITIGMVGDVNHDGSVDVIDAVTMINFILMFSEPSDSQFWAADVNEDGTLNVLDVVLLVDMILSD